ncbi:MAG: DUF2784 family protein [Deltaproteobacteria bacterium]|nr:DUF2784 family protein [Deltaproteobacteria bacterium]
MGFKIAADLFVFIHFLWILFIILGFPLFLYFNLAKWRLFHLAALIVTIIMQLTRTICPLTYLEAYLKSKDLSHTIYPGSFIIEAVEEVIYVRDVTLELIAFLTLIYFIAVVLSFWLRPIKRN